MALFYALFDPTCLVPVPLTTIASVIWTIAIEEMLPHFMYLLLCQNHILLHWYLLSRYIFLSLEIARVVFLVTEQL